MSSQYIVVPLWLAVIAALASIATAASVAWLISDVLKRRAKATWNAKKFLEERYDLAFQMVREKFRAYFPADFTFGDKGQGWYFEASNRLKVQIEKTDTNVYIHVVDLRTGFGEEFGGSAPAKMACAYIDRFCRNMLRIA